MSTRIVRHQIMSIVCRNEGDARTLRQINQRFANALLSIQPMLLDLKEEQRRTFKSFSVITGLIAVLSIAAICWRAMVGSNFSAGTVGLMDGATRPLGQLLFTQYLLPFEIVSVLLLVAMIGVILLSKKDVKP